jgi:hypothetical protein
VLVIVVCGLAGVMCIAAGVMRWRKCRKGAGVLLGVTDEYRELEGGTPTEEANREKGGEETLPRFGDTFSNLSD